MVKAMGWRPLRQSQLAGILCALVDRPATGVGAHSEADGAISAFHLLRWDADVCSWIESEALCRSFEDSPVLLAFDNIVAELAQKAGAA